MTRHRVLAVLLAGVAVAAAPACATGPSTKAELCEGFDRLDQQLLRGNGIGNPLFDAIDDLAGLASRYPGGSVATDARRLDAVDDDDVATGAELQEATAQTSALCDRPPVGLGWLTSG